MLEERVVGVEIMNPVSIMEWPRSGKVLHRVSYPFW